MIMFALMLTLISVIGFQQLPFGRHYATGLPVCFTIATIINGIYVDV